VEHQLWKAILAVLVTLNKRRKRNTEDYSDEDIVKTWFWAVLHDRPVSWACDRCNWPVYERRRKRPSPSVMSRRLRTPSVRRLLEELEERMLRPHGVGALVWAIDGKPLAISGCSKDRQAGYGRAAGGKAKGYKLHALVSMDGTVAAWRVAPMNKDEREMARRMLRDTKVQGYVLADSNYDSNPLHELCGQRGELQLVAPPRYGFCRGRGHRRQSAGRLRSIAMLSNPQSSFGRELHAQRDEIERYYGNLTNWAGGLTELPPWARTHRRVHRWVQAKLILKALRQQSRIKTYVA
jgi:hypothetical protein